MHFFCMTELRKICNPYSKHNIDTQSAHVVVLCQYCAKLKLHNIDTNLAHSGLLGMPLTRLVQLILKTRRSSKNLDITRSESFSVKSLQVCLGMCPHRLCWRTGWTRTSLIEPAFSSMPLLFLLSWWRRQTTCCCSTSLRDHLRWGLSDLDLLALLEAYVGVGGGQGRDSRK